MSPIERLTADDFASHLGKPVRIDQSEIDLVLARIDRPAFPGWEQAERQPFSLILRGPRAPVLPEGLHPIEINEGLALTLYIIPIFTPARDRQDYQVVFN